MGTGGFAVWGWLHCPLELAANNHQWGCGGGLDQWGSAYMHVDVRPFAVRAW